MSSGGVLSLNYFKKSLTLIISGDKMRKYGSLILVLISVFFFSCENTDSSISGSELTEKVTFNSSDLNSNIYLETISISKIINGDLGGTILLDTTIQDRKGNPITINLNLTFEQGSFSGSKTITIIPEPNSGSIQFFPAISFNKPAKFDLNFTGIDLNALGFTSNSTVDFVYISDGGKTELILKDEVKIKFNKSQIYTKKAQLPHFSRYAFVRKSC